MRIQFCIANCPFCFNSFIMQLHLVGSKNLSQTEFVYTKNHNLLLNTQFIYLGLEVVNFSSGISQCYKEGKIELYLFVIFSTELS